MSFSVVFRHGFEWRLRLGFESSPRLLLYFLRFRNVDILAAYGIDKASAVLTVNASGAIRAVGTINTVSVMCTVVAIATTLTICAAVAIDTIYAAHATGTTHASLTVLAVTAVMALRAVFALLTFRTVCKPLALMAVCILSKSTLTTRDAMFTGDVCTYFYSLARHSI